VAAQAALLVGWERGGKREANAANCLFRENGNKGSDWCHLVCFSPKREGYNLFYSSYFSFRGGGRGGGPLPRLYPPPFCFHFSKEKEALRPGRSSQGQKGSARGIVLTLHRKKGGGRKNQGYPLLPIRFRNVFHRPLRETIFPLPGEKSGWWHPEFSIHPGEMKEEGRRALSAFRALHEKETSFFYFRKGKGG